MRLRVGLTGGIGAGKSVVGAVFAARGALVIDADELARRAVERGSAGLEAIRARWPQVVSADGELDRAALGRAVFADPTAREALNAIVHPAVRELGAALEASAGPGRVVVHEVPLLFETGFAAGCDANVVVVAPVEARIARVIARSGLSREEILARMAAQIDPERARSLADIVIENDGTLEDVRSAAARAYDALLRLPPRPGRHETRRTVAE